MDELGIKIISDIDLHFENDPEINEYDILPLLDSSSNRSPVFVVDHKMAIEAWAARIMVCTAGAHLGQWQSTMKENFSTTDSRKLLSLTRAILLVVADHMTSWNFRKRLVQQKYLNIKEDIAFCDLIVYKHRKTPETFAHRRWLLQQLLSVGARLSGNCRASNEVESDEVSGEPDVRVNARLSNTSVHSDFLHNVVRHELEVCNQTADRYPNNYHAWSHRLWVVESLACCVHQVITEELVALEHFVSCHVSDHSGFHYRQFLLNCVARVEPEFCSLAEYWSRVRRELQLTAELDRLYPGHEAIWYHRRFVLHQLVRLCSPPPSISNTEKTSSAVKPCDVIDAERLVTEATLAESPPESEAADRESILSEEIVRCQQLLSDAHIDGLPWHRTLVERQIAWTKALMARTLTLH